MPGPLVAVKARTPFQLAPSTMPMAAISSSAFTIAYRFFLLTGSMRKRLQCLPNASASEVDGVIGYQAQTVAPAQTQPSAAALLPEMKMRSPTLSWRLTLSEQAPFR